MKAHPMQKFAEASGIDIAVRRLDAKRAACPNPTCDKCLALLEAGTELMQLSSTMRTEAEAQVTAIMGGTKR